MSPRYEVKDLELGPEVQGETIYVMGDEVFALTDDLIMGRTHTRDERGTGRTTMLALRYVRLLLTCQGGWVLIEDHTRMREGAEHLMKVIQDVLRGLGIRPDEVKLSRHRNMRTMEYEISIRVLTLAEAMRKRRSNLPMFNLT